MPWVPKEGSDYSTFLKSKDWYDERDVINSLKRNGHKVNIFGIYDDVIPLIEQVKQSKPDLVFNMCESFNKCRDLEPNLVAILEILGVKYTGANSQALSVCKDKGLTKKILNYHNVQVPSFTIFDRQDKNITIPKDLSFPSIVKPLDREASEGISSSSRVMNEQECKERILYIKNKFNSDVIVEEYIPGRELYIGVMGNKKINIFPPMELFFKKVPKDKPKFLTYKAKWDQNYRKKWGIDSNPAKKIDSKTLAAINKISRTIYKQFNLSGYARFDLRLTEEGEVYFIEANPNPSIARIDDFAQGAKLSGIPYDKLIEQITKLAVAS